MRVVILMGSKADREHADKIAAVLKTFEVPVEIRIASAHKAPRILLDIVEQYDREAGSLVYIAIAGRSNALSGVLDWATLNPVITCPPPSQSFGGADIFSSLRMPSGIATPTILEPEGAALLAVKLLGLSEPALRERLQHYRDKMLEQMQADDRALVSGQ
ncbi:MAG: phosphoribosylaminoimidazole carboxylase [Herpetosiphonaceae bacterium]|nr:MAG: phosphoribosylaminoimidazole carboxylase [Herpetosiphonaceae bacterium]